ncbi:MAG: dUTP diphosphatase [Calditrichia bacterium]
MNIRIYRKYKNVPLPTQKTSKSAGLDVYCPDEVELLPGKVTVVPTGLIIEAPENFYYQLFIRSGFAVRNNVSLVNDVGIIDGDYCGPEDEIKVALIRHLSSDPEENEKKVIIKKGERFAQIIFAPLPFESIQWDEQDDPGFAGKTRGGFGSTGQF